MIDTGIKEVRTSELNELLDQKGVVLADFYASWCPPCRAMTPIVEQLAARFAGQANVVKVDVDRANELASTYGVRSIPTFLLFANGQIVERVVGTTTEAALVGMIESHLVHPVKPSGCGQGAFHTRRLSV